MFDNKKFGKSIRKLRKLKGYGIFDFALELNINSAYLGQIERGEKIPSIDIVVSIINFFHVSINDCFLLSEEYTTFPYNLKEKIDLINNDDSKFLYKLLIHSLDKKV